MKTLLIVGLIVCVLSLGCFGARLLKAKEAARLENTVRNLQETIVPVKFSVLKRTDDSLTVELHMYDLSGREVGSTLRTLAGSELSVDFIVVPFPNEDGGLHIAFPYRLFTEAIAPADGIPLVDLYNGRDGFPAVFENGVFTTSFARKSLIRVYADIRNGVFSDNSFGSALHEVSRIAEFRTGKVYEVHVHPLKGGMEIH